ncbi:glycosyltransferase family 87 protein [Nakamurella sp. GG22]
MTDVPPDDRSPEAADQPASAPAPAAAEPAERSEPAGHSQPAKHSAPAERSEPAPEPAEERADHPAPAAALARSASLTATDRVIPSWTDPTVRRASDAIGGPMGRHALVGRATIFTPLRVCLLMAIAVLICGWLFKSACIQQGPNGAGGVTLDQGGQRPWITACYNDAVPLFGSHLLDKGDLPYATSWEDNGETRYMEYPVVTGYWMWAVAQISSRYVNFAQSSGILPVPLDVAAYFTIGAIFLGLMYLWAVASTARIARRRVWDTAIMCLSPLLVVHAFTNWDLLAIGITAAAMLAWARKRPVLAGALIGLGAAAKLYPILLLGPLLVLCLRTGKMGAWSRSAAAAAVVWLVINVPVRLLYPDGWYEFIRLNSERPPEYDSWYFIYATLTGSKIWDAAPGADAPTLVNLLSLGLFLLACTAIGWLALSAQRRPRFAQLAFLVIAAFLLTNKVWSPQYSLWLLPLAVLALPRWRPLLLWQASEAIVWVLLMLSFAGVANKGLSIYPFINAALLRDALLLVLIFLVIRDILRPAGDLVRMTGDDDPSGGVLEDAADRFTVPSLPALLSRRRGASDSSRVESKSPSVATASVTDSSPTAHL